MPDKTNPAETDARLRSRAEQHAEQLAMPPHGPGTAADAPRLLHELEVHQIELELQNAELRSARDELELMLEKYTDLYDFAPVGYFTLTADGTIRLANLTGSLLVGIERSRLIGRRFGLLVSAPLRSGFDAFLQQVLASEARQSIDSELLCKDQAPKVVNIAAQRSPNGQEYSIAVVDITERRQAEDRLRVSEIRYRRLFETAHDGVLVLDPDSCKITDANPFMTKLLGYPRNELIGKELFEIGLLKDEAASKDMFQNLKRTHEVRYEDLPLESQGGRHQEVEVVANLYQENGHSVIQCNIRDITERKLAEAAQRRLDVLTISNQRLNEEIVHRQAVEAALQKTEQKQTQLLKHARLQQDQLRNLSHRILHAQEEERKRISRELHDVIAQTLVGINVHVAALTHSEAFNPDSLQQKIAGIHQVVEESLDTVHRFARQLRPSMLDDLGLIPALQAFMKTFVEDSGVRASLKAFAGIEQTTDAVRTVLYRVAQEALTNVARHARASQVELNLECIGGMIRMEIKDDGQGFKVHGRADTKEYQRLGLLGMRERVEMIGGTFAVESAPGHSTTIRVEIPKEQPCLVNEPAPRRRIR
jgi:PAS domain S-box-containing protein